MTASQEYGVSQEQLNWEWNQEREKEWESYVMENTYTEAVCCMRGMDCWSSAYENSQGLAGLTDHLRDLEGQYPHAKDWFDELNADNLKKEREARLVAFAESNK